MANSTITVGYSPIPFGGFQAYGRAPGFGATLIDFPSDMRSAAAVVDQNIRALMLDVDHNRQSIPYDVAGGWDTFVNEWEHFTEQDEGAGEGWLYGSGLVNEWSAASISMDSIHQRQQTLIDWRTRISQYLPSGLSSPDVAKPPGPTDPLGLGKIGAMLPWVVGGVLAIYLLPPILGAIKKR
jgi:hypothetical protein